MYQNLRSSGVLSYDVVEQMFEDHQSAWSESIFNEDAWFKYILPFVNDNQDYLYMLQGSKTEQRKWWLYNRFRYIDSKYNAGDALNDRIYLRGYAASNITITPYADIYPTVLWASTRLTQARGHRNTATVIQCPLSSLNETEILIYSASQLASVGDLSGLQLDRADFSSATRIQSIKIGDASQSFTNPRIRTLTLGNNILLSTIDARNCTALSGTIDASGCSILENVYFSGTAISGITVPNGGIVKVLDLPETITNLTILNQPSITTFSMEGSDYSNIETLNIENCSSAIPIMDILDDMAAGNRVRIIGFTMAADGSTDAAKITNTENFYTRLETMRGVDERGVTIDNPQVRGTITGFGTITGAWLASMTARFPDITLVYNHITSNLFYYNGETLYYTESITDGGNGTYSGTPTKTSTAQYSYTFAGWSKDDDNTVDSDARTAVTADRNIYACYTSTVRTYTVYWKNADGTTLETDTNVPYGTVPTYNGATPTYQGATSTGWSPAVAAITGNTTYTATYVPNYTATFVLSAADSSTGSQYTLQTVQVQEGSTPAYTGATPTTAQGDTTEFTFTGWSPALAPIYANTTYVAQFQDNRAVTIQYLSRNITEYESDSNTTFAAYGLGYATKLTSATAPATSVAGYAFANDTALEVVDLSATSGSVTIANSAFNGCTNLQHVIIRSSTMATLSSTGAFTGTPIALGEGAIYVPTSLVATYKANTNWSNYYIADIADYPLSDFSTVSDSWSTIIANANYATDYSVGDAKLVDFGTFGQHYFELVAMDEDTKASGGTARMTWLNKNFLTTHVMNTTATTTGGYDASNMKSWITSDVLPQLQSEIRNALVPVTKISGTYENSAVVVNGQSTTESLWIASEYEMFGTTTYENTGARYSKFDSDSKRIKYNSSGSANYWWLRSAGSAGSFRYVYSSGSAYDVSAYSTIGVVLGFCI